MSDVIHLLPDSIANQIAAGEVIQRPASVVKELVENALDANATIIRVYIKDAGKTLIQVIDNGTGMSETDARMSFERHATSKISTAADLFSLRTMGFRGEALASIAAVAQIELRTRQSAAELGTRLSIAGSILQEITPDNCDVGSNFAIKNLFFNIPVRRKFLKSNDVEFRHIITEFERIALVYPDLHLSLYRESDEIFNLPKTNLRQRIINIFGKAMNQKLLPIDVQTSLASISGFVASPDSSKKRGYQQYFFVNGRYMKHAYFHKAVMTAYDQLIPNGEMPDYFIYFSVDPSSIDVNIHPTKTEIKFENEQAVWQVLLAVVRESLGKMNAIPTIDFNTEDAIKIPVYTANSKQNAQMPAIHIDKSYNPFKTNSSNESLNKELDWQALYQNFETENKQSQPEPIFTEKTVERLATCQQYGGRFIITTLKSGLAVIDQHRAHMSILYNQYFAAIKNRKGISQQVLFPEIIELSVAESLIIPSLMEPLQQAGFDINPATAQSYFINGIPAGMEKQNPTTLLRNTLAQAMDAENYTGEELASAVALSLAKAAAIPYGKILSEEEMNATIAALFSLPSPKYAPNGKLVLFILSNEEIENMFR
ncbi:MAG: DNA mismatch repair endonuclease MutL [Tannerellaceae bacterium]|jgi:DNA mismatch repair protein MutL|nr:DNA mismatch repair endonuclease MutL [Tannerellaceae bacterium]